ncbi:hypothetical protein ACEN9F_09780 [Duganella sp. CT11-25]|uniref:hypothetical protein n=1 Tax=unclassified Duganella TaxID=2636909 RepID=UPI0039AF21F8
MRKYFITAALVLSAFSASANACTFNHLANNGVNEALNNNGGWMVSDQLCAFLNKNRLSIEVLGDSQVLNGISIGWAVVGLVDKDSNKRLDTRQYNTFTNTEPSTPKASQLLAKAINKGIQQIDANVVAEDLANLRSNAKR